MAVLTTLMGKGADADNRPVTCYTDINNALLAIITNSDKPISVQAMTGLIRHRIIELDITPRSERAPSIRNITELPTRSVEIKYKSLKMDKFRMAIALPKLTEWDIGRISKGLPIEKPSTGNRALVTPLGNKTGLAQKIFKQEASSICNEGNATALRTSDPPHRTLVKSQARYRNYFPRN